MKKLLLLFLAAGTGLYAQTGTDNFKGMIQNNTADSLFILNQLHTWRKAIPINKSGHFSAEIRQGTAPFYMQYNDKEVKLFLTNDSDLTIAANADFFTKSLVYKGKGAAENNLLADMERHNDSVAARFAKNGYTKEDIDTTVGELTEKWMGLLKNTELNFLFRQSEQFSILQLDKKRMPIEIEKKIKELQLTGKKSPDFTYENYKGGTTSLSQFKGKYIYIDVWATWCEPCRGQLPFLEEVEEKYKNKNIAFVSISIDKAEDHDKWMQLVKKLNLGGTQLLADNNWKSDFIKAYGIRSIPRFIFIGPDGKVIETDAPRPSDPRLEELFNIIP